jgi:hypothetical protein
MAKLLLYMHVLFSHNYCSFLLVPRNCTHEQIILDELFLTVYVSHVSQLWNVRWAAGVRWRHKLKGSKPKTYISQLLVALSCVILFAVHGIWHLMVVWFSVITLTHMCCHYCFPIIVSCTYGIHTASCHIRPPQSSWDVSQIIKDHWKSRYNLTEKWIHIAKHLGLAPPTLSSIAEKGREPPKQIDKCG